MEHLQPLSPGRSLGELRIVQVARDGIALILSPHTFFKDLPTEGVGRPGIFLLSIGLVFGAAAALIGPAQDALVFGLIFWLNGIAVPVSLTVALYPICWIFGRKKGGLDNLFAVTAFSQISLAVAWIPGMVVPAGIWRCYLIWVGLSESLRLGGKRAAVCLSIALLLGGGLIQLTQG